MVRCPQYANEAGTVRTAARTRHTAAAIALPRVDGSAGGGTAAASAIRSPQWTTTGDSGQCRRALISEPWTVRARITTTSSAIIINDQTGYAARKPTFTMALTRAMITPTVRAQIWPVN